MQDNELLSNVNRQIAIHSTDPRSRAGRTQSAKNALEHGLKSANPVVAGEDAAQWLKCLHGIQECVKPKDFLEGEIARAMACLVWRQQRHRQFELDMTQKAIEEHLLFDKRGQDIVDLRECVNLRCLF